MSDVATANKAIFEQQCPTACTHCDCPRSVVFGEFCCRCLQMKPRDWAAEAQEFQPKVDL